MSLKAFHFFFVFVSLLLSAFVFYWTLQNPQLPQAKSLMVFASLSFVVLVFYALWLPQKWKRN